MSAPTILRNLIYQIIKISAVEMAGGCGGGMMELGGELGSLQVHW